MRPPPPGIPGSNSSKWRSRRSWDGLGYVRARTLSNPSWTRDIVWPTTVTARNQVTEVENRPHEKPFYDAILAALRRYPRTASGIHDADVAWDQILEAIDALSLDRGRRQAQAIRDTWGDDYGRKPSTPQG